MSEPILDLTYRPYSGAHERLGRRWLVIARMGWHTAFRKRAYWVFTLLGAWYYLVMLAFLYVLEQVFFVKRPEVVRSVIQNLQWKDQFLTGFTYSQLVFLVLSLLVGAGAIANDNGTHALLVYLSKPCRKSDYLLGKWVGVFVPLFVGMALPTAFFYLYGLLNYREYGFVSQDPYLGLRLFALLLVVSAFQTSLVLGVSSLFNKGRMAGAAYSAAFFLLSFFSFLMFIAFNVAHGSRRANPALAKAAERLYYASLDGLEIGWAKLLLRTDGKPLGPPSEMPVLHAPPWPQVLWPTVVLALGGLLLAWRRVRAVEVVK